MHTPSPLPLSLLARCPLGRVSLSAYVITAVAGDSEQMKHACWSYPLSLLVRMSACMSVSPPPDPRCEGTTSTDGNQHRHLPAKDQSRHLRQRQPGHGAAAERVVITICIDVSSDIESAHGVTPEEDVHRRCSRGDAGLLLDRSPRDRSLRVAPARYNNPAWPRVRTCE